ncbi:hypothetical protein BD309DRAFT_897138 [Dichomitus squalens]|uniref:Nnf1-domain-containing protein n=2 Tax=Dichomitus squalens TaxID=114155 RepID=A0A4Q9MRF2_9APHY|nr:uncharacterized protein DICSQDRAFT_108928 [Dichomitus squalens LYAD-421 SS1]EJF59328.1 hypothetical protein DICSQDRAFT_108928 [Dichomitus squalens LYAD-421 SS1]TBU30145.1 hypothetical protein BD311DRAFT_755370 [Dichomitus squalens]TBU41979.1 hypothetical protein BD309DRAFT_897138 [Dichomitus squalens]TBU61418.1 hypothetical protein BD310DRAFT_1037101 [Dichomitus squalens]
MASSASTQPGSKRWSYFHSALQLAIQRSAHKWTYEDFAECFSLWCDEQPENAATIFNLVSSRLESSITENCEELFKKYNVKDNLDNLHAVVTAARARKQAEYDGKDVWREDLQPRAAVRARTIPLLEQERDRLRAELAQLTDENSELQSQMQQNVRATEEADRDAARLLDVIDKVLAKWDQIPLDDIQSWTLQTAESAGSRA